MNAPVEKRVSVAMTTFNGVEFLRKQLDSILNQTVPVHEIIVCDDGSTDGTLDILKEYSKHPNFKYFVNQQNLGFVKNFETALSHCTEEYIVLSDQDDIWYAHKVQVLLESIGDNLLIHSDCDLINEKDEIILNDFKGEIKTHTKPEDFLFANVVTGCTVMIHRDLLQKALPFPKGISYHDWYLALHAAYLGRLTYIPKSLTGYRQHTNQDTGSGSQEKSSIIRNSWKRIKGAEFSAISSHKRQLNNLKATLNDFSDDLDFHKKHLQMIKILEEYVNSFFHFSYGFYYSNKFIARDRSRLVKLFYQLKFSVG